MGTGQPHGMHGCADDASAQTENVSAAARCDGVDENFLLARPVSNPQPDTPCEDSEEEECSSSEDEETQSNTDSSSDSDDAGSFLASPEASTIATGREICHSTGSKLPSEVRTKGERPLSETTLWRASVLRKAMTPHSSPLADSHCGDPSMSLAAVLAPPLRWRHSETVIVLVLPLMAAGLGHRKTEGCSRAPSEQRAAQAVVAVWQEASPRQKNFHVCTDRGSCKMKAEHAFHATMQAVNAPVLHLVAAATRENQQGHVQCQRCLSGLSIVSSCQLTRYERMLET